MGQHQGYPEKLVGAMEADTDLEMRPEILETPIGQLSKAIAGELIIPGEEVSSQSAFIPILIGLLPVLADLLAQNCDPSPERLVKFLQSKRPRRQRFIANRINEWTVDRKGITVLQELGGKKFGECARVVLADPTNEMLVVEAFDSPPPITPPTWGILN